MKLKAESLNGDGVVVWTLLLATSLCLRTGVTWSLGSVASAGIGLQGALESENVFGVAEGFFCVSCLFPTGTKCSSWE